MKNKALDVRFRLSGEGGIQKHTMKHAMKNKMKLRITPRPLDFRTSVSAVATQTMKKENDRLKHNYNANPSSQKKILY